MNSEPRVDKVNIIVHYADGSKHEYTADPSYVTSEMQTDAEFLVEELQGIHWKPVRSDTLRNFHLHLYRVSELEVKVTDPQPVDVEAIIEDDDRTYAEEQRRKRALHTAELTEQADKLLREIFGGPVAFRHDRGNRFEIKTDGYGIGFIVDRDDELPEFTNAGGKDLRPYALYKSGTRGNRIKITRPADFRRY